MSVAKTKVTAPPVDEDVLVESLTIQARDGYDIAADLYSPSEAPRAAILLAGAYAESVRHRRVSVR